MNPPGPDRLADVDPYHPYGASSFVSTYLGSDGVDCFSLVCLFDGPLGPASSLLGPLRVDHVDGSSPETVTPDRFSQLKQTEIEEK